MPILAVALGTEDGLHVSCEDFKTVVEHTQAILDWIDPEHVSVTCVCVTGVSDTDKEFAQAVEDALDDAYGLEPWSEE